MSSKNIYGLSLMLTLFCGVPANATQKETTAPAARYQKLLDQYEEGAKAPELAVTLMKLPPPGNALPGVAPQVEMEPSPRNAAKAFLLE